MSFIPELWCTALLVDLLSSAQALRWAVERARHRAHVDTAAAALRNTPLARGMDIVAFPGGGQCVGCLASMGDCLLRLLQRAVEYASAYAYSFVAIYGHDFKTAGTMTLALFQVG